MGSKTFSVPEETATQQGVALHVGETGAHSTAQKAQVVCIRPVDLSITYKLGLLVHDRFDFVPGGLEGCLQGALARVFRRIFSMSLPSVP